MIETIHIVTCDSCGKELLRKSVAMPTPSEVIKAGGVAYCGKIACEECIKREYHTDNFKQMPREVADAMLNEAGKEKWCAEHNVGANLYWVKNGKITDVDKQGWWY